MRRTCIHFPGPQLGRLQLASKASGLSIAEIVRRAVDATVPDVPARAPAETEGPDRPSDDTNALQK